MAELLLELFSEEIPARMQQKAAERLETELCKKLTDAGIRFSQSRSFRTPRRLITVISEMSERSSAVTEYRKGPRPDAPDGAINGFLKSAGLTTRQELEIRESEKGTFYYAKLDIPGRDAKEIVAEIVPEIVENFTWPKSMRWGEGTCYWVRPLKSILCVISGDNLDSETVDFSVANVTSGNRTQGHEFMANECFEVKNFADYEQKLRARFVMINQNERRELIEEALKKIAQDTGTEPISDKELLEEVVGLSEYPVVLSAEIPEAFQDLPDEILRTSMRNHQKFFSFKDPVSENIKRFVTVSGIQPHDGGEMILNGNLRVLAARLSDAKYFLETDLKSTVDERLEKLKAVTFHAELGSQHERTDRIVSLASEIAILLGADEVKTARAAILCKTDLVTETVGEFPELQGVTGRCYALLQGEDEVVAYAVEEHYRPQGPKDKTPSNYVSICVALADKLDQLAGFWVIDEKPTGSKDPFALRRAALGVIRLILENKLSLNLFQLLVSASVRAGIWADIVANENLYDLSSPIVACVIKKNKDSCSILEDLRRTGALGDIDYQAQAHETAQDLNRFILERLKVYLRDRGARPDIPEAICAGSEQQDILLVAEKVKALEAFLETDEGDQILSAYRRAVSILTIEERKDKTVYKENPDPDLAREKAEEELLETVAKLSVRVKEAIDYENVRTALTVMAEILPTVNAFFNSVIVNCAEPEVRINRLFLLNQVRMFFHSVADFSQLDAGKE